MAGEYFGLHSWPWGRGTRTARRAVSGDPADANGPLQHTCVVLYSVHAEERAEIMASCNVRA